MNPHIYSEHHLAHRRFREYYRRTLAMGAVALGLAIWMGSAQMPMPGPGLFANAGFSAAGIFLLWALRNLHTTPPRSRWGQRVRARSENQFPAIVICLQGWFILLIALLIWFTVAELGFAANGFQHTLLIGILLLAPVRRILDGTEPPRPSPRRDLIRETLAYLNVCLITLFIAAVLTTAMLPPDAPATSELPFAVMFIWVVVTLILLTCAILLLDHIVRKMPPTVRSEEQDTLN
ncbi:MAG: hypothetical protein J5I99_10710 [Verrucomicrobia bacterium]|nr:hypothetical protein [Kiritimatiellia bacterium]MCO6401680.1 hypothetical protein [Verrucomicrobiota bacterium]